jgi:hypothetical protein
MRHKFGGGFGILLTWINVASMRGAEKGSGKGVSQEIREALFGI